MQVTFEMRHEDGVCRSEEGDKRPWVGNGTWEGAESEVLGTVKEWKDQ